MYVDPQRFGYLILSALSLGLALGAMVERWERGARDAEFCRRVLTAAVPAQPEKDKAA